MSSLGAIPTIAKLQEKAETMRLEEMNKVYLQSLRYAHIEDFTFVCVCFVQVSKKLASLSSKDLETVEKVTKGIVAKLLHGPMSHLRQQTEVHVPHRISMARFF